MPGLGFGFVLPGVPSSAVGSCPNADECLDESADKPDTLTELRFDDGTSESSKASTTDNIASRMCPCMGEILTRLMLSLSLPGVSVLLTLEILPSAKSRRSRRGVSSEDERTGAPALLGV